jgi:asparagine synthase (glutamine-hydrolysing)
MCGIVGAFLRADRQEVGTTLMSAASAMRHRGPDAKGLWVAPEGRLGFAHRRLTIIDLSDAGNQPMTSPGGRFVICFNGEIYNYQGLRSELVTAGVAFRSHSDTEVVLAAVETWGLSAALDRFIGMFAFALWDSRDRCVYLVRDRLGVKPLYLGTHGDQWAFASEIKALRHFDWLDRDVSREAVSLYLRYGYIPAPYAAYRGVRKVSAGTVLRLTLDGKPPVETRYWDPAAIATSSAANPSSSSPDEVVEELEALLDDSIRLRMVADVPVGAFLSGGIDSSTVVALMRRHSPHRVKTFTIGFREPKSNEAQHALRIARHLDTEHHELYIGEAELARHMQDITRIGDEPFADPSILPTWIVSRLAAEHVKVVLSGDGGDEFFGGYNHYLRVAENLRLNRRLPRPLGRLLGEALCRPSAGGGKLARRGAILAAAGNEEIARAVASHWQRPARILRGGSNDDSPFGDTGAPFGDDLQAYMMLRDTVRYLPDDIMHKVDRASMAASLEAREPVLDHRLFEFAWRLPAGLKIRDGQTKWPLRQILARHVPRELFERPKQGFGVPVSAWLRGELRGWSEDLLADPLLDEFFDGALLRRVWQRRVAGRSGRGGTRLWDVLLFLNWLRHDRDFRAVGAGAAAPRMEPPTVQPGRA